MTTTPARISLFCGRFGSGKTEISLNYAWLLAERALSPLLVDLDVVTPYFRTRDESEAASQCGIEVITPFDVGHHIDVPALSPRIHGAFEQPHRPVVVDLGGDVQGSRVLAQYRAPLDRRGYAMYFCVNPYRPFMDSVDAIGTAVRAIEGSCGLRVSALVSNPNLMSESTPALFAEGHRLVEEAARAMQLPVAFAVVSGALSAALGGDRWTLGGRNFVKGVLRERPADAGDSPSVPVLVIHRFFVLWDDV